MIDSPILRMFSTLDCGGGRGRHSQYVRTGKARYARGQIVTIYEDPLTETKPEGKAQLMSLIETVPHDGTERWIVQFLGDDFHNPVPRLIKAKGEKDAG